MTERNPWNWITAAGLLAGLVLLAAGVILTPSFVSAHLSPDGVLERGTVTRIAFLQVMSVAAGLLVLFLALWARVDPRRIRRRSARAWRWMRERPARLGLILLLVLTTWTAAWSVLYRWPQARGAEYLAIAESLAAGQGFSLNETDRWYWYDFERDESEYDADRYYPTALEEPVYPALLGSLFRLYGEPGKVVMLLLQVLARLLTCVVVFYLGKEAFDVGTGTLAAGLVALWPSAGPVTEAYLGPAPFGALLIAGLTFLLIRFLKNPSFRNAAAVGILLGVGTLTLAATLLFIPLAAILAIIAAGPARRQGWQMATVVVLTAGIVVTPWTVRNWVTFGQAIPVRTGSGLSAHVGNPVLAGTYLPGPHACTETLGPMWEARNASEAIKLARKDRVRETAIYKRSFDCVAENAPEGFEGFNEAERDEVYAALSRDFIRAQPSAFMDLIVRKLVAFLGGWRWSHALVVALAGLGALLSIRNRRAVVVALVTVAFVAPYAYGMPWGYRYRYPIEPLLLLLASYTIVLGYRRVATLFGVRLASKLPDDSG